MRKKYRKKKQRTFPFALFLIIIGCVLMSLWATHRFFYTQSMSLSSKLLASYAQEKLSESLPIHISVGNIRLPIVEAGRINNEWTISQTSANHVHESANPGTPGNIIIYAHNSKKLFGTLEDVKKGDSIEITTTDGARHRYVVTSTAWVTTGHTELLAPTTAETLTLYTCGGLLDSLRIVVQAVPSHPL